MSGPACLIVSSADMNELISAFMWALAFVWLIGVDWYRWGDYLRRQLRRRRLRAIRTARAGL